MKIQFLTISDIIMIHDNQVNEHGGLKGLRDKGLLHSAVHYSQSFVNQQYLHPDIYHMAAAYMYAIIKNHPFVDGNKRTGILTAIIFLKLNGIIIESEDNELFNLTIAVVQSRVTELEIAILFKQNAISTFFN